MVNGWLRLNRDALVVRNEVALAPRFRPVCGSGACVGVPQELATLLSMRYRLKSTLSARPSSPRSAKERQAQVVPDIGSPPIAKAPPAGRATAKA